MERGLNLQGHVEGAARDVPIPLASPGADRGTQAGEKAWDLDTSQRGATPLSRPICPTAGVDVA